MPDQITDLLAFAQKHNPENEPSWVFTTDDDSFAVAIYPSKNPPVAIQTGDAGFIVR